jgi:hypothetical protein
MQTNVGTADKIIRVVIGIALLTYAYLGQGQARWIGLIGIVPILTVLVSFCPLYALLGVKTSPTGAKP